MTFGSLFSGIGGIEIGLERAGMSCRWQSEIDPYASRVLAQHWPEVPNLDDITKIEWSEVERVDIVCGGFPCQPHSLAGKRKGSTDERNLWPEVVRCLREVEPRWFLGENVPGLLSSDDGRMFATILGDLAALGYDATWCSLRASDFGAPHRRERIFLLAYRGGVRGGDGPRPVIEGTEAVERSRKLADSGSERCGEAGELRPDPITWISGECAELANALCERRQQKRGSTHGYEGEDEGRSSEYNHVATSGRTSLAHSYPRGRGSERGTPGSAGHADERGGDVADAMQSGPPPQQHRESEPQYRTGSTSPSGGVVSNVPDAEHAGLEERGRVPEGADGGARAIAEPVLPPFPPGPADRKTWAYVIDRWPWLAPSLSQEEAESLLRRMADGFPNPLDARTRRLKALGNAVVPQVAQFIGEVIREAEGAGEDPQVTGRAEKQTTKGNDRRALNGLATWRASGR